MKDEGIFKMINGAYEKLNQEQFIIRESWKKTRDRLQLDAPNAKIKFSYKTKQFTVYYSLPVNWKVLKIGSVKGIVSLEPRR